MGKRRRNTEPPDRVSFFVRGVPKAQPRGRTFFHPKLNRPVTVSAPKSHSVNAWRDAIAMAAHARRPAEPWAGPVRLDLLFLMPRPKNHFRTKNRVTSTELKQGAPSLHLTSPDRDNLDKAVMDELKTGGWFSDDSLVFWGLIGKVYHPQGTPTGCLIRVTFMEDDAKVSAGLLSQFADDLRGVRS